MIIRFRGKDGAYRVQADAQNTFSEVIEKLQAQLPGTSNITVSNNPNEIGEPKQPMWNQTVQELGIAHGDMFYIHYINDTEIQESEGPVSHEENALTDDPLDLFLSTKDGLISRDQTHLCTHGSKGMCEYCQPLAPWNEEYQQEKGIKHTSIHAWRKKIIEGGGVLEENDYKVNVNCRNPHKPWPAGYCSSCQPSAITLQFQKFRMVDHVEFISPKIVEQFIEFWRQTSKQRVGFLIGRYKEYEAVPLGIKAEVHAIWEPEQINDVDAIMLGSQPTSKVLRACELLELEVVGFVFTDLLDAGQGKVVCKRHIDSYFLTSLELSFAAKMQNTYKHNLLGQKFSSRFVTCCISGNSLGDIDIACYQASTQAEALLDADLIVPSTNPAVVRVLPESQSRYVPEIFYKRINEYKLTVLENAKPSFPVDYLVVSCSHGFSQTEVNMQSFTIENRRELRGQTYSQLAEYFNLNQNYNINLEKLFDFHALLYLLNSNVLSKHEEGQLKQLLQAVNAGGDVDSLKAEFLQCPGIVALLKMSQ